LNVNDIIVQVTVGIMGLALVATGAVWAYHR